MLIVFGFGFQSLLSLALSADDECFTLLQIRNPANHTRDHIYRVQ